MAKLSPQDQAYWKEKLGWTWFLRVTSVTVFIGCVIWPIFRFVLSWQAGHAGEWTWGGTTSMIFADFFVALLVSTIVWCVGQLYLLMDWLPPRQ